MTVLYFAHAKRLAGLSREEFPVTAPINADTFWLLLLSRHPSLASLRPSCRLARGDDFLPASAMILPNDEIALIPPVSGG